MLSPEIRETLRTALEVADREISEDFMAEMLLEMGNGSKIPGYSTLASESCAQSLH
jgi:hypothetical protein